MELLKNKLQQMGDTCDENQAKLEKAWKLQADNTAARSQAQTDEYAKTQARMTLLDAGLDTVKQDVTKL